MYCYDSCDVVVLKSTVCCITVVVVGGGGDSPLASNDYLSVVLSRPFTVGESVQDSRYLV
jgi:hypothetical protein